MVPTFLLRIAPIRFRLVPVGLLALLAAAGSGDAQPTPGADTTPEWIRPEEVPARADRLLRELDSAGPTAAARAAVEQIEASLPKVAADLDAVSERAADAIEKATAAELEDIRREITATLTPLVGWKDELAVEAQRVAALLDEVAQAERTWSDTRSRPETADAGDVVIRRVESALATLHHAEESLRTWRTRVLAASDEVLERAGAADVVLEKLQEAAAAQRAGIFVPDRRPLWASGFGAQLRSELPRVPEQIAAYAESTRAYIARDFRPLLMQTVLAVVLMIALRRYSSRLLQGLAGEAAATRAARLLERPYAIGMLLMLIASPAFHPLAPRRFTQLVAVIALFPAARIVMHVSERAHLAAFASLFVLLILERVRLAIQELPAIERATFLLIVAVGFGVAFWFSRRSPATGDTPWLRRAANLAMLGLTVALLAEVGGWTHLATLLGRGIIASVITGVYVYAAEIALSALVGYAMTSRTVRRSRLLGSHTVVVQRRVEQGLRWLAVGFWLYLVAIATGLRSAVAGGLTAVLAAGFTVGELSLSLGGVLAFVLTLVAAFVLARIVTAVLEEDVYPRTHLPRGVPYALSTMIRYGFYSLGFFFALVAAGVQLGQLAIMLGGVGIGIGLGLQDLVKNFAAGLTLLFERRVHVGDTVEMPNQEIFGRVLSIGMRASVVRGWTGSEIVVPNADLTSSPVTNWTLSDRLYRIEVAVGVGYESDPEQVITLLLDAVRSNNQLLTQPPPQALFKGFGDSSLNFVVRAWIDQGYDMALPLTSELALAVHRTLREAGVTIPFPQRDLHLASVSPQAGAALAGVRHAGDRGPDRSGST